MGYLSKLKSSLEFFRKGPEEGISSNSAIPKILHFNWGLLDPAVALPQEYQSYLEQWRILNSDWDIKVHGASQLDSLARNYPDLAYSQYSKSIQRSDACRPMLLHKYGGVYSDLDVEPHRCLDRLLSRYPSANVILAVEVQLSDHEAKKIGQIEEIRSGVPEIPQRLSNYFMASVAGHPFWLDVLDLMKIRSRLPVNSNYDVLYTTGPDVITEIAQHAKNHYPDVKVVSRREINKYITHHCRGAWRQKGG